MKDVQFEQNSYLWDGQGAKDVEIARLERTLAPLRYQGKSNSRRAFGWALAAGAVAAVASLLVWFPAPPVPGEMTSVWTLVREGGASRALPPDAVIETTGGTTRELQAAEFGYVRVGPKSRLRLLPDRGEQTRVALDYGSLRAFIVAPPAKFAVDTPATTAVDLGCIYTLESDRRGDGRLQVEVGWVALETGELESFIPAGAGAEIRRDTGPGIPLWDDAPADLRAAVARLNAGDRRALNEVMQAARRKDGLTLWHLLARVEVRDREAVASRFTEVVSLPADTTVASLASLDPGAMDSAWNALALGDTSWWRGWKQQWPARGESSAAR